MVDLGSRLCIVLPHLSALQARLQQEKFILSVHMHKEDCSTLTPELVDKLLAEAETVVPHRRVETERATLYKLKCE